MEGQEGVPNSPAEEQKSTGLSRRDFFKLAGGFAAGVATREIASQPRAKEYERRQFAEKLRNFNQEDLGDPEDLQSFFLFSAQEYGRRVGIEDRSVLVELVRSTYFYQTADKFVEAVRNAGEPDFSGWKNWGSVLYRAGVANINLEAIRNTSQEMTERPGILLYKVLLHEWGHLLTRENLVGRFLHSPQEMLYPRDGDPEQWEKYRGGEILTKNHHGLESFDETWVEYMAQKAVMETIDGEEDLAMDAAQIFSEDRQSAIVRRFTKIVERAELSLRELQELHATSDLEGLFVRMGSVFNESALEEVAAQQRGNRSDEEMRGQKDYLIGKRLAFLIDQENWDAYKELLKHLNSS